MYPRAHGRRVANPQACGSPNACCVSTGETCDTVCVAAAAFYCVRPADCHGSDGAIEACCLSGDAPQPGCPLQFDTNVSTLCSVGSLCPMGALHVCVANGDCGMVETCKPATIGTNTTFTFGVCQ